MTMTESALISVFQSAILINIIITKIVYGSIRPVKYYKYTGYTYPHTVCVYGSIGWMAVRQMCRLEWFFSEKKPLNWFLIPCNSRFARLHFPGTQKSPPPPVRLILLVLGRRLDRGFGIIKT